MKILRKNSLEKINTGDFICLWEDKSNRVQTNPNISDTELSYYNFFKEYNNGSILINTLTESVIVLNQKETENIKKYKSAKVIGNRELFNYLYEEGIIIPKNTDELSMLMLVTSRQLHSPVKQLKVAVNTTYDCNANCDYCFECNSPRPNMSMEVANDVVDYICRVMTPDKKLTFRWFGGEPLVAPHIIDYIISNVKKRLGESLNYDGAILTNGTLLTSEIIEKIANEWHIREVHFTLDGYREIHNKKKHFKDLIDGYQLVIDNMKALLPLIERVTCRVNIDKKNIHEIDDIFSDLNKLKEYGNLKVYPAAVRAHNENCLSDCYAYNEYSEVFKTIYEKMYELGLLNVNGIIPVRKVICCSAKAVNEVVVGTNGNFYKCMQTSTFEQNPIGSCKTGLNFNEEIQKWIMPYWPDNCKKCKFLPACQGGCKGYRGLNNPNISPCLIGKYTLPAIFDMIAKDNNLF